MQIGFVGLGKMGGNMVHRIERDSEHETVAFDFDAGATRRATDVGAAGAGTLEELVAKLRAPRTVWLMVPAGDPTERTIDALAELLEPGDLIVDGGNSRFTDAQRHADRLASHGVDFVDVGTSGGIWGLEFGYCMMVGGSDAAVARLAPILDVLAPPPLSDDDRPGWRHFGAAGAGHYVKMVHNGVEYGLMQAYAEGFALMHASEYPIELAGVAELWNRGSVVRSWLCELAGRAFEAEGDELAELSGYTPDSGEGRWTLAEAIERDVPTPVIAASLYARFASRGNDEFSNRVLAALRSQFGGHAVKRAE